MRRIAAAATVASAAVMVETMTNQLNVNGAPAMPAMEAALTTIRPNARPAHRRSPGH